MSNLHEQEAALSFQNSHGIADWANIRVNRLILAADEPLLFFPPETDIVRPPLQVQANLSHPVLGQDFTPSSTVRRRLTPSYSTLASASGEFAKTFQRSDGYVECRWR